MPRGILISTHPNREVWISLSAASLELRGRHCIDEDCVGIDELLSPRTETKKISQPLIRPAAVELLCCFVDLLTSQGVAYLYIHRDVRPGVLFYRCCLAVIPREYVNTLNYYIYLADSLSEAIYNECIQPWGHNPRIASIVQVRLALANMLSCFKCDIYKQ